MLIEINRTRQEQIISLANDLHEGGFKCGDIQNYAQCVLWALAFQREAEIRVKEEITGGGF